MIRSSQLARAKYVAHAQPAFVALLVLGLSVAGCSSADVATVTGTVMVDGEPANAGAVSFFAVDGRAPTAGAPIVDGHYTAHVRPGLCYVQVRVSRVVGEKKLYDTPESPVRQIRAEVLPAKYNDDTELQLDVKPGHNEQNYDFSTK